MAMTSVSDGRQPASIAPTVHIATVIALFAALRWSISEWRRRARSRHELRAMTDLDLLDVGISRASADLEASKPFWQR